MEKYSSEDESDVSDSEIMEYKEKTCTQLRSGKIKVKCGQKTFRCPFCPGKMKQAYDLKELLQHAKGIGAAHKRKAKVRATHLGLADYLEKYLERSLEEPLQMVVHNPETTNKNEEEKYVWPWMGILVNLQYVVKFEECCGETEDRLRAQFSRFRPVEVTILGDPNDQSLFATIKFAEELSGFDNGSAFEMYFITKHCGKADWNRSCRKDYLYGWLARSDDYFSSGPIGEHLKKNGVLRSVGDLVREGKEKTDRRVSDFIRQIWEKNKQLEELELKKQLNAMKLCRMREEKYRLDEMLQGEINKRCKQLEDLASNSDIVDRATLEAKMEKENKLLHLVMEKQEKDLCCLLEKQKIQEETDETLKMLTAYQMQLDAKHKLELEVEKLTGKLEILKFRGDHEDMKLQKEIEDVSEELAEKDAELESIDDLNQVLISNEGRTSEELEEAKKEMIRALEKRSGVRSNMIIGVKRMGQLDQRAFREACKLKIAKDDFEGAFALLYSKWEYEINQPEWYFDVDGKKKETIQEDDEKLQALKAEYGKEAYDLVVRAICEMRQYSPHERCPEPELWDFKKDQKATVPEVAAYLVKQWRASKNKRAYT
ncbi:hypothetical protein EJB05_05784, partial [Eragrostis curvula]